MGCARRWFCVRAAVSVSSNAVSGCACRLARRRRQLPCHHPEGLRVGARLRERQIDQLEHRLEIASKGTAAQAFVHVSDVGTHEGGLAGQLLAQIDRRETPEPALADDLCRRFGGDEVLVARERRAARTEGAEQDLVLLERRRLQHDSHAVRQRPLGDAGRLLRDRLRDRARLGRRLEQRPRADGVDVGGQGPAAGALDHGRKLRFVRERPIPASSAR